MIFGFSCHLFLLLLFDFVPNFLAVYFDAVVGAVATLGVFILGTLGWLRTSLARVKSFFVGCSQTRALSVRAASIIDAICTARRIELAQILLTRGSFKGFIKAW